MFTINGNAIDQNGAPVVGAQVYVFDDEGVLAELFAANGDPVENPVITGDDGFWQAFVEREGFYRLSYWWGGRERKVIAKELVGRDPIAQAEAFSQIAAAFSGPIYLTIAAGLAATADGEEFAVDNGDGTASIYANNSGTELLRRNVIIAPAAAATSGLLGHIAEGAGAVARTVADKLRERVTPFDFMAPLLQIKVALRTATSSDAAAITDAIVKALATGRDVDLLYGLYFVQPFNMANNDQTLTIGKATLKRANGVGGHLITITGAKCGVEDGTIDGNRGNNPYTYNLREILCFGAYPKFRKLRIFDAISMGIGCVNGALAPTFESIYIERCGDGGVFVNGAEGTGPDPAYGTINDVLVVDFGLERNGLMTTAFGVGIRSSVGGWAGSNIRAINNVARTVTPGVNELLGIEIYTNGNKSSFTNLYVQSLLATGMQFGVSLAGSALEASGIVEGTDVYAWEITGSITRVKGQALDPRGAGFSVNLNPGIPDTGDVVSIEGFVEGHTNSSPSLAGFVVDGEPNTDPINVIIKDSIYRGTGHGFYVSEKVKNFTVSNIQATNLGSDLPFGVFIGSDGQITGIKGTRVPAVGANMTSGWVFGGSDVQVKGVKVTGNSKIDNAVLCNSDFASSNMSGLKSIGVNSNTIVSNSTATDAYFTDNYGDRGFAFNAANKADRNYNTVNGDVFSQNMQGYRGARTVAQLAALPALSAGDWAYATDASATTYDSVVAGGGVNRVRVHRVGTDWRIG